MDFKFCPKCGNKLPSDALFCNNCGEKLQDTQQESSNVENSSPSENVTTQEQTTPKVEEQQVIEDDAVEPEGETQKEKIKFFAKVIFYSLLIYFFGDISFVGAIFLAAIAYLSYRYFVKKFFVSKNWSLKFLPELCTFIGLIVVSVLSGGGSGSGSSSSGGTQSFTGTYTLKTIDRIQVGERAFRDDPGEDIQYVIHPNGSVVFFHGNTNYGIVGEVDKTTKDAVYLYIEYGKRYKVLVQTTNNNTESASGSDLVFDRSSGKFYFSVKDYENRDVITPTTAWFKYSSEIRK